MKTRYIFRLAAACFCALILSPLAFAQTFQLNGANTTCTSWSLVPTGTGVNLVTVPANCLAGGGGGNTASVSSVFPSCVNGGGTSITISGQNLAGATSVSVGGQTAPAPFTAISATSIQLAVPAGVAAGVGTLTINTPNGNPTIGFQVGGCQIAPVISIVALSSAPTVAVTSAPAGSKLTIGGFSFANATATVNGLPAIITAGGTSRLIEITIPASASGAGNIVIKNTVGSASTPFTVSGGGGGGDVSVTGKVLGNPSKTPNAIPSLGDGGAGINAFDMATSRCLNSPTPIKSWQHNIDLTDYKANAALDFIAMGTGQSLTYKFTTPASGGGSFQTEENTQVTTPPTMISVSESPCDFNTAKLQFPGRDYCYSLIQAVSNIVQYEITPTGTPSTPGNCGLKPGATYYFNMRFLKPSGATYIESCPAGALCGATLQTR
jgi:IPT/TIG domain